MYTHFLPTPLAYVEANPKDPLLSPANTSVCISKRNRPSVKKHNHTTTTPKIAINSLISVNIRLVSTLPQLFLFSSAVVAVRSQIKCINYNCLIYFLGFFNPIL